MHIKELIEKSGLSRQAFADKAGISYQQLNNAVSKDVQVEKLADGRYMTARKDATYFDLSETQK